jgi:hypothetical protein
MESPSLKKSIASSIWEKQSKLKSVMESSRNVDSFFIGVVGLCF